MMIRTLGRIEGHLLEGVILRALARDYEELAPRKAPRELDLRHGTDLLVDVDGETVPVGLTTNPSRTKWRVDVEKASRRFGRYVELFFDRDLLDSDDPDVANARWNDALDNAGSFLLNDLPAAGHLVVGVTHTATTVLYRD